MSTELLNRLEDDFPIFASKLRARPDVEIEQVEPPATDDELTALEETLGVVLPDSYKRLLRCSRGFWMFGGAIQFGTQHPFFHEFPPYEQLTSQQQQRVKAKSGEQWPPPSQGMLCFAEFFLEADGDQVLFDVGRSVLGGEYPIMYYAHESRPPTVRQLADGFVTFMDEFLDYDEWRHDDDDV